MLELCRSDLTKDQQKIMIGLSYNYSVADLKPIRYLLSLLVIAPIIKDDYRSEACIIATGTLLEINYLLRSLKEGS